MCDPSFVYDERDRTDALLDQRGPLTECPMCGKRGSEWRHPDPECQAYFDELASEWYLAEGREINAAACSPECWQEFVITSQGGYGTLEFDGDYEHWRN